MHGLDQQEDQSADRGADDRAEGRDQVREADDDGDESRILHAHDPHENQVGEADDERIEQAEGDIARKDAVAPAEKLLRPLQMRLAHGGAREPVNAELERVLCREQIHREDERNDPVGHALARLGGGADDV